jgi:multidrug efflux pump subunit AcrB
MLLTPLLCRFFIKKGLHSDDVAGRKKKFDILDFMQAAYNRAITFLMGRKWIAVGAGIAAFVAGVFLFTTVPQQFFPSAERNQFVIDVWMPPVSRLEQTDVVIQRIETFLKKKTVVDHIATFAGQSFPRFYYNVSPQEPDTRYGQLIVITRSADETPALIRTLRSELPELAPEALVMVKELQQGSQIESPVEVRISGDDIAVLKTLGTQVEGILRTVPIRHLCSKRLLRRLLDGWGKCSRGGGEPARADECEYCAATLWRLLRLLRNDFLGGRPPGGCPASA